MQTSASGPQDEQPTIAAGMQAVSDRDAAPPGFRERGRLRRRLRYLRRVRELGFRDLGGLVFDLQRFGRTREDLVQAKIAALGAVDGEMRALETLLDDRRALTELREPGISSCPRCGALHGSDARFCPACGLQLAGPRPMGEVGLAPAMPATGAIGPGMPEGSGGVAPTTPAQPSASAPGGGPAPPSSAASGAPAGPGAGEAGAEPSGEPGAGQ